MMKPSKIFESNFGGFNMNIGRNILELRKQKGIKQEELAAELGVTAAAVSKWENGYTLPDILMLCALADFFEVTTDELLGRNTAPKQAIVVAKTEELGQKIADLIGKYNMETKVILTDLETALAVLAFEAEHKNEVKYLFTATGQPLSEEELDAFNGVTHIDVHTTGGSEEDVLQGIEMYLKNMSTFHSLSERKTHISKHTK